MCRHDLVRNFHEVLPLLKELYASYLSRQSSSNAGT
jgi:hypothetical protein